MIEKINQVEPTTFSDFRQVYKSLKFKNSSYSKKIKIALLTSFTTQGLDEVLAVKCRQQGIKATIYCAPYNQYNQEIFNPGSGLYKFNPDLVILFIDVLSFFGDYLLNPYHLSPPQRKKFINQKFQEINSLLEKLAALKSKILIHNFEEPAYSPLGILENKQQFGFQESIRALNQKLAKACLNNPNLFVFDYNLFCSIKGKNTTIDYKMYYLADMRLPNNYLIELGDKYLDYIKPLVSIIKKCLVLDLDNTLWGGILGEVGIEGIDLGPTPKGMSFWEFQKYILSLYERGIILAINSRNNLDEVLKVLKEHPFMILKEEHFSSIRANWQDKATNMKTIAKELNIGLDSLVFLDDDPFNRDLIRKKIKEVIVIDLPEDKSLYLKTIKDLNVFNTLQITDEDRKRGKMYKAERKRRQLEESVSNIEDFTKSLGVLIKIEKDSEFNIPRISQLTQKTNQFNMTTRRYLEGQIKSFSLSQKHVVYSAKVEDKFGDYGLTGVLIIEKKGSDWLIDSFLLSCRVLGRKIEESIMAFIIKEAKKQQVKKLTGQFIKTTKNAPAENFYKKNKFKLKSKLNGMETWEFNFTSEMEIPNYVKILA